MKVDLNKKEIELLYCLLDDIIYSGFDCHIKYEFKEHQIMLSEIKNILRFEYHSKDIKEQVKEK